MYLPEEESAALAGSTLQLAEQARNVARGFLMARLPRGGPQAEAVLLVVSELVTNAVQHAGGVTRFGLKTGEGTVTVVVEDSSRRPPRPRPFDRTSPGGFGWPLVQTLAQDVQVSIRPDGKTVSAVLPLPE